MTSPKQTGLDSGKGASPRTTNNDNTAPFELVHVRAGKVVTDSRAIAREFKRPHKNVLRTLDSLIGDGTIDRLNYEPIFYIDEMNREQRALELDERGALIAMPFVGGANSRIGQARLVDAFLNLRGFASSARSTVADRHALYRNAAEIVVQQRALFSTVYRSMGERVGAARFRDMTLGQVREAESFSERLIEASVTSRDWSLIAKNRVALGRTDHLQLHLFDDAAMEATA